MKLKFLFEMRLSKCDFQTLCLSFTVLKSFLNMEDYCLLGHYLKPNWFMRGREGGREKSFPTASSFLVSTLFDSLWVALGTLKMEVRCSTHLSTYDGKKNICFLLLNFFDTECVRTILSRGYIRWIWAKKDLMHFKRQR